MFFVFVCFFAVERKTKTCMMYLLGMLQSQHVHAYKKQKKMFQKKKRTVPSLHRVCCTDFVALLWNISESVVL